MSWVWQHGPKEATERLVLLALADHANDDGVAYPSVAGIAEKACCTERGARGILRRLEAGGWLVTKVGGGRGGKSNYTIRMLENPERSFPVNDNETRNDIPGMPNPERETRNVATVNPERGDTKPGTYVPPNHHLTIIEPSEEVPPLVPPPDRPEPKARLPAKWALSDEGWAYARSKNIPDEDIEDEARGFHAYWSDRTGADARKSARGWEQCWAGWCRRIASRYRPRGGMAVSAKTGGHGQGRSLASIVAQRQIDGKV